MESAGHHASRTKNAAAGGGGTPEKGKAELPPVSALAEFDALITAAQRWERLASEARRMAGECFLRTCL